MKNLSPSPNRIVKTNVCIFKANRILMVESEHAASGWTFPGGGVDSGETLEQAAVREAWEEAGAVIELGELMLKYVSWSGHPGYFFRARLISLEPSPEGRKVQWVDPFDAQWCEDRQVKMLLEHLHQPSI